MGTTELPPDFKEFLRLLRSIGVKYLLIGGYAVHHYGYHRATNDLDIWVAIDPGNADRMVSVLEEFGFRSPDLKPDLFLQPHQVIRMGIPPTRLEILTTISGVDFEECHAARNTVMIDDVEVELIGYEHLKRNKAASGRLKDLDDLQHLK